MLISFPIQGYGFVSILFSTLSVFASYYFAILFWKDLNRLSIRLAGDSWFKLALLGNFISSAGPFSLAYMMASHNMPQNWYLASIYFYLHFQYNIWFFFACMGLLSYRLAALGIDEIRLTRVFRCFALAALPTYFLSVLWWHIPVWLYIIVALAAVCQLAGWVQFLYIVKKETALLRNHIVSSSRILFIFFGLAVSIKLLLQTASVIPAISRMAFGFRPIVIGYLHLILLGIISIFLLAYCFTFRQIHINSGTKKGVILFVAGIIFNELLLMIQGVADLFETGVPGIQYWLLFAAALLLCGTGIMVYHQLFSKDDCNHKTVEKV
jgi:hypothetical protein